MMKPRKDYYGPNHRPLPPQIITPAEPGDEAPETLVGEPAIAAFLKVPVESFASIVASRRGRPNRPPVVKIGGVLVAEKPKIVAWWRAELRKGSARAAR